MTHYVYALLDPRKPRDLPCPGTKKVLNFLPRYIGKGQGHRLKGTVSLASNPTTTPKGRWLRRLLDAGLEPIILILKTGVAEDTAFALEKRLIAHFGRKTTGEGCLFNLGSGGEGRRHTSVQDEANYRAKLKGTGFTLVSPLVNFSTYVEHRCRKHGIVSTAPAHVLTRLEKGRPLCPKCGVTARGPKIKGHRLANGEASYKELLAPLTKTYRLVAPYTGALKLTAHRCKHHGDFDITPANVRQKLDQGLTPCPSCNMDAQAPRDPWKNKRQAKYEDYKRLLVGNYRLLEKDPEAITKGPVLHKCKVHGKFMNSPNAVRANLRNGRTPCQLCNLEVRNSKNANNAHLGGRRKN